MSWYISKPFKEEELYLKIEGLLLRKAKAGYRIGIQIATHTHHSTTAEELDSNLEWKNMQICDIDYLEGMAGGDKAFMGEVIAVFIKQAPVELEKMQEALAAKNMHQFRQIAHKLRSTVSVVGAESMRVYLQQIEELAYLETEIHKIMQLHHQLVEKSKIAAEELKLFLLNA